MRVMSAGLRLLSRFIVLLAGKLITGFVVIAMMLSFSIASFAVPTLATAISNAATSLFGSTAVVTLTEMQSLRQQNQALQRANREVTARNRTLAQQNEVLSTRNQRLGDQQSRMQNQLRAASTQNAELDARNQRLVADQTQLEARNRTLASTNQRLTTDNTRLQSQIAGQKRQTAAAARRIGQRAVRTTTRSIAAIPLESVPIVGISTIIATTVWEIHDACRTLDDMTELQILFGEEPDKSFAEQACARVSSLQASRVGHYGRMSESKCRSEAEAARQRVYQLIEKAQENVPDLIADDTAFDAETERTAESEFLAISIICDCIADLNCDPEELVQN